MRQDIELLAPAGNLSKLKTAIQYGADAVYLGGRDFNLRVASDNFTENEMIEGVQFAHSRGAKVFVTLNNFFMDEDFEEVFEYLSFLKSIEVDALICSDLGLIYFINEHFDFSIHLSTQASCVNRYSGQFWKNCGVSRLILGREVSIAEASEIKKQTGLEVELFIHGAMCMAYSGNCTISNFTAGRDSNRGGCAQSCRFEYSLENNGEKINSFFMSSKDLNGLNLIDQYIDRGIDSIKIEGRMKSNIYVGTVSKTYRKAIDMYLEKGKSHTSQELEKISHRGYTQASLIEKAGKDSIANVRYSENELGKDYLNIAKVIEVKKDRAIFLEVLGKINIDDIIEIIPFKKDVINQKIEKLLLLDNREVEVVNPGAVIKFNYIEDVEKGNIVRREVL